MKASSGLARGSTAAMQKPGGSSLGTSFIEWTAISARDSSIATSSSLTNRPLPPTSASARSSTRSPCVVIGTSSTGNSGWALRSRAATCSACHKASLLRRVAMRKGGFVKAGTPRAAPRGSAGGRTLRTQLVGRKAEQRHEQAEHDRAEEQADEPKSGQPAHDAYEDRKGRHFDAARNKEWPQEVVHGADDEDAPAGHE